MEHAGRARAAFTALAVLDRMVRRAIDASDLAALAKEREQNDRLKIKPASSDRAMHCGRAVAELSRKTTPG